MPFLSLNMIVYDLMFSDCMLPVKGHMKGYIARERGIVVLSKKKDGVFPGTGV